MALGTMEPPVNHLPPPPPFTPLSVALCVLGHCTTYKKKKKKGQQGTLRPGPAFRHRGVHPERAAPPPLLPATAESRRHCALFLKNLFASYIRFLRTTVGLQLGDLGRSRKISAHSAARPDPEPGSAEGARAPLATGFILLPGLCPRDTFRFL